MNGNGHNKNSQPVTRNPEHPLSRRSFLNKAWGVLGIIAGIEFTALIVNFLYPGERKKSYAAGGFFKTVGKVSEIPNNSVIPFRSGRFYLVRLDDGGLLALSLRCTHLGCSVTWDAEQNIFICPCHSSTFTMSGDVIKSPAPRALDLYRVVIEQGMVKVDISKPISRKHFNKDQITYA
jgi:cytochrome b6-f complex iron-sulfur subunit